MTKTEESTHRSRRESPPGEQPRGDKLLDSHVRLTHSASVLFRRLRDEAMILDLETQQYFGLDAVGVRIWQEIEEHGRPDLALAALDLAFDVDGATLRSDLLKFLDDLLDQGLLVCIPPAGPSDDGSAD